MDPEIEADCFDPHRGEYVVLWDKHVNLMRQRDELVEALEAAVDSLNFSQAELRAQASIPQEDSNMITDRLSWFSSLLAKIKEASNE